jgi:predicted NUDIX family NTP pyrophosphohydrolase
MIDLKPNDLDGMIGLLYRNKAAEVKVMNALQGGGLVSDNCVGMREVPQGEFAIALRALVSGQPNLKF